MHNNIRIHTTPTKALIECDYERRNRSTFVKGYTKQHGEGRLDGIKRGYIQTHNGGAAKAKTSL